MSSATDFLFDTNVIVDWLRRGEHESIILGPGIVRYLSAVVVMELRAGVETRRAARGLDQLVHQFERAGRLVVPTARSFDDAGKLLPRLKAAGGEIRRSSLVNDVLIALSARQMGATVYSRDRDFARIGRMVGVAVVHPS